jgi:hypothetical protein
MGASRHWTVDLVRWLSCPSFSWRQKMALLAVASLCWADVQARPQFDITVIGPAGTDHVRTIPRHLNDAGQVAGLAYRSVILDRLGHDAWFYDGTKTVLLGFIGEGFERDDGYRNSVLGDGDHWGDPPPFSPLNEAGQVVGESRRFSGSGPETWLYDGASTVVLPGLSGSVYVGNSISGFNNAAQVIGYSSRNDGGEYAGIDAWLSDGAGDLRLGLSGPIYERADGCRTSYAKDLNDAGQVVGTSKRYKQLGSTECQGADALASGDLGRDVWLFDGTNTVQLGFTGSGYERPDGYRKSTPLNGYAVALNAAGQVAGGSERYDASGNYKGEDTWLYNGNSVLQIGLIGTDYLASTGTRYSSADVLNDAGQVAGLSIRYGLPRRGIDAWLYDGASSVRIGGLTGPPYESAQCGPDNRPKILNEAGQVAGSSNRAPALYNDEDGCSTGSEDAWLFDGTATKLIGLIGSGFGANYESTDGERLNYVKYLNDAGQAAGETHRYIGSEYRGQDAWVYDSKSGKTYTINLSTNPSDGRAVSYITHLDENGNALGGYFLYDQTTGIYLGNRAFYFSLTEGQAYPLEDLVAGGISVQGWTYLEEPWQTNQRGQIIGFGEIATGEVRSFLLTPTAVTRGCAEGVVPIICPLSDLNGDGTADLAAIGGSITRAEIRSGADGTLIRTLPFLDNAHEPIAAAVLQDSDGDGVPELAVLAARISDSRPIVEIRNLDGAGSARSIAFAPGHTPLALAVVSDDLDDDGNAELAVLSTRNTDGRGVVEVRDANDPVNIGTFWAPAGIAPHDVELVPDAEANGVPEIALLATRVADGSPLVRIWSADGSGTPYTRSFRPGQTAIDLAVVPDKDDDGIPEIAVLSSRDSDDRLLVELKNVSGVTNHFQYWLAPGLSGVALEAVTPTDGSAVPEIAVLAERESDGRILVTVRNAFGADAPRSISYTVGYTALGLSAFPDSNGNGHAETAVLARRDSDGRLLLQRRDVFGTPNPQNVWLSP